MLAPEYLYTRAFRMYLAMHTHCTMPKDLVPLFAHFEHQRQQQGIIRAMFESKHPQLEEFLAHYYNYLQHTFPGPNTGRLAVCHTVKPKAQEFAWRLDPDIYVKPWSSYSPNAIRGFYFNWLLLLDFDSYHHRRVEPVVRASFGPIMPFKGTVILVHVRDLNSLSTLQFRFSRPDFWLTLQEGAPFAEQVEARRQRPQVRRPQVESPYVEIPDTNRSGAPPPWPGFRIIHTRPQKTPFYAAAAAAPQWNESTPFIHFMAA